MNDVRLELEQIAEGGLLNPHAVVEFAKDEDSALHSHFEWDDSAAGEKYRLEQARRLIRVFVIQPATESAGSVRAFVSLTTDRKGGGYRVLTEVLDDADLKAQLLADALAELRVFQRKYARLVELEAVFTAAAKVEKNARRRKPPAEGMRAAA